MKLIHTMIHPDVDVGAGRVLQRTAVRAIAMEKEDILLLYTKRYDDFSFPGGGIDQGETLEAGLRRELKEETGASGIRVLHHYGYLDEYRPHWKPDYDHMFMRSHFYICTVDRELGETSLESYEQANGTEPRWINLHEAIQHNDWLLRRRPSHMGLSLERETWMLKKLRDAPVYPSAKPDFNVLELSKT